MRFIKKLNPIHALKKIRDAEGVEVWVVYWDSVQETPSGSYWDRGPRRAKAFFVEKDAEEFADILRRCNHTLQNKTNLRIEIIKQQ